MYAKIIVALALAAIIHAAPEYHGPSVHGTSFEVGLGAFSSLTSKAVPVLHAIPVKKKVVPAAVHAPVKHEHQDHPKYAFAYGVEDHHTGDIHSHKEVRDGDKVQGEYSLHEADGSIRIVKYSADKYSGFNAIVTHVHPSKSISHLKV